MKSNRTSITAIFASVISLGLLAGPRIFPICRTMQETVGGGMVPMRCHYTYQAEFLISLVSLLASGALFFVREEEGRRLAGWGLAVLGLVTILLPQSWVIGVCTSLDAPCRLTYRWTLIGGLLLVAFGVVAAWRSSRASGIEPRQEDADGV